MSSKPIETPSKPSDKTDKTDKTKHDESPPTGGSKSPPPMEGHSETTPALNKGQVHMPVGDELPPVREPPHEAQKARLHMDQIDAVATSQGVVLFALTEGGEIWQLTTPGGQPVWHQILTPEAPPEDA